MREQIAYNRSGLAIGYREFALFRGYWDGLRAATLAERYLESDEDPALVPALIAQTREELIAAAQRYAVETGKPRAKLVKLLRLSPEDLASEPGQDQGAAPVPSLEDFRADYDPTGDFYSEAELIEAFQERHGRATAAMVRNAKLRQRVRRAIELLEQRLAPRPRPDDPLAMWLIDGVARPLAAAGVQTIADLVQLVNRRGYRWYRQLPRVGHVRAQRVLRWLQMLELLPIAERALAPYRQILGQLKAQRAPELAIVPSEYLALSAELAGVTGANRGHQCQLANLRDDADALREYLTRARSPRTRQTYFAQIERFRLFLVVEKGRALSSATAGDCWEYRQFLAAVATPGAEWPWRQPRAAWIGDKLPRESAQWKPFTGQLSVRSQALAITVLKALYAWWVKVGYLRLDPWAIVDTPKADVAPMKVDHALNARQWAAVLAELDAMPRDERYLRLRVMLFLAYSAGLRPMELRSLTADNLERTREGDWDLRFVGKGAKERVVAVASAVMSYLQDYLAARGYGRNPLDWYVTEEGPNGPQRRALPLITTLAADFQRVQKQRDQPLSARTAAQILDGVFAGAAERLNDLIDADGLRQASGHWLRHTAATVMLERNVPQYVVQAILGHASGSTTGHYSHAKERQRRAAAEAMVFQDA